MDSRNIFNESVRPIWALEKFLTKIWDPFDLSKFLTKLGDIFELYKNFNEGMGCI